MMLLSDVDTFFYIVLGIMLALIYIGVKMIENDNARYEEQKNRYDRWY